MIEAEEDTTPLVADMGSSTGHGMAPRTLGMSLFPVFMRSKSEKLFDACKKGNVDKVSLILKDSPKLASFKTNLLGVSALHAAAAFGEVEVVKELIRRGAKVNTIDSFSRSPLMYACRWGASPEIIQTLLEAKARPYRTDDKGRNCLHFLVKSRKSRKNRATSLALILSPSINRYRDRTDINQVDKKGNTPLHQSCQNGNVRLSKMLIQNGASVTIENAFCETALELGCQRGGVTCGLLRMLVEAGSDTDRIRDIDLSSIGAEEVPECLMQFHNIRHLDLSRNNLRSVPSFLLDIPSLRSVDLHENPLDDLPAHIRSNPRWKSIKRSISSPSSPEAPLL